MRRSATAIVVVGVVALAVLAIADAFRRSGGAEAIQSTSTTFHPPGRPTLAGTLRRDAISGQLVYSDFLCRLRTIVLPGLRRDQVLAENGAELAYCNFSLAAGHFLEGEVALGENGATVARCSDGRATVRNVVSGRVLARTKGCPAAWRPFPDGTSQLTQVRGSEIVVGRHVLVSRGQLLRTARRHPILIGLDPRIRVRVRIAEVGWLDQRRVAVILAVSVPHAQSGEMLALLDRGRPIGIDVRFEGPLRRLVISSHSNYVAVEPGTLMDATGRSWQLPRTLGLIKVLGFSPDERWLALGTRGSVYLVSVTDLERNEPTPRIDQVPILATDLVWEPGGAATNTLRVG